MVRLAHLTTVDMSLELLLGHQLRAARDAGYEVVGVSGPGPWVEGLEADGIRHFALSSSTRGWNLLADLKSARQFWSFLRREKPLILHTHNPKPGLYGRILGRLAGVPIVINTIHGLYATPDDPFLKRAVVYVAEALAIRFSDHELVQSVEDLSLLNRLHLASPDRLTYLGNGVDLEHFDQKLVKPEAIAAIRSELGLAPGSSVVGVVGRLVAEKGLPELFEAFRLLRQGGATFSAIVVGPTDEDKADALPAAEIEAARAEGVHFLGLRRDMREIYAVMDLFVLASHREGFPRAAMEAAAMGVPIVATDIRGCREVVDQGRNGLLVPVRSPRALANGIGTLLSDPELRRTMGHHGREIAQARFDARTIARVVLDTYELVAKRKGVSLLNPETDQSHPAVPRDARAIADLHVSSVRTGFLSSLGPNVLTQIYRGLIADPEATVLVVRDQIGELTGFVAGAMHTGRLYKRMLRRRALPLGLAALPGLAVKPGRLRRAVETLRYPAKTFSGLPDAELLAMAVAEGSRSKGLGTRLVADLLERLAQPSVRVVVGAENQAAVRFYRAQGFKSVDATEVHEHERSEVLVWRFSSD